MQGRKTLFSHQTMRLYEIGSAVKVLMCISWENPREKFDSVSWGRRISQNVLSSFQREFTSQTRDTDNVSPCKSVVELDASMRNIDDASYIAPKRGKGSKGLELRTTFHAVSGEGEERRIDIGARESSSRVSRRHANSVSSSRVPSTFSSLFLPLSPGARFLLPDGRKSYIQGALLHHHHYQRQRHFSCSRDEDTSFEIGGQIYSRHGNVEFLVDGGFNAIASSRFSNLHDIAVSL